MAKIVLKDAYVLVNSVNLSDHCEQAAINISADEVDFTAFSDNYKEKGQGIKDASITLTMQQDFAAGSVDATLWPLFNAGSTFPVEIRPTSAARSATNPAFLMTGVLLAYSPLDGSVGDKSTTDVEIQNGAQAGLTRVTA